MVIWEVFDEACRRTTPAEAGYLGAMALAMFCAAFAFAAAALDAWLGRGR